MTKKKEKKDTFLLRCFIFAFISVVKCKYSPTRHFIFVAILFFLINFEDNFYLNWMCIFYLRFKTCHVMERIMYLEG